MHLDSLYGRRTETIGIRRGPHGPKNILMARPKSAQQNENALEDGKLLKVTTHRDKKDGEMRIIFVKNKLKPELRKKEIKLAFIWYRRISQLRAWHLSQLVLEKTIRGLQGLRCESSTMLQ